MDADDIIRTLELEPHPEGGWYRETFRAESVAGERGTLTAIYYLLRENERSHWHRVLDADEAWNWYVGAPLALSLWSENRAAEEIALGSNIGVGERPQAVVPKGVWQSARTCGTWSLVGCMVAPAFEFAEFEMAPPQWEPRMRHNTVRYRQAGELLAGYGLILRGGFWPSGEDEVPGAPTTLLLVGNAGPAMWESFSPCRLKVRMRSISGRNAPSTPWLTIWARPRSIRMADRHFCRFYAGPRRLKP